MIVMMKYPPEMMIRYATILAMIPTLRKSLTVSHDIPVGSSKEIAFMFGNDETGRPIAPEHMRAGYQ